MKPFRKYPLRVDARHDGYVTQKQRRNLAHHIGKFCQQHLSGRRMISDASGAMRRRIESFRPTRFDGEADSPALLLGMSGACRFGQKNFRVC